MENNRVRLSSVAQYQLPDFVKEQFPLVTEFISEYYKSLESNFGPSILLQDPDVYTKIDKISDVSEDFYLVSDIDFSQKEITIRSKSNNLKGLPSNYGLIQIDDEIILYKTIQLIPVVVSQTNYYTEIKLIDCQRGFSGVTSLEADNKTDELVFSESSSDTHTANAEVLNLSILFFKEFVRKIKKQFLPGFENRELYSELNESIFIKQSKDFYSSKGTDSSFKILFRALYGENVEVIKPRDYLIQPSDAQYKVVRNLVAEKISGDPYQLLNRTLYQDNIGYINNARGTVSNVEKITRGGKDYYVISLDDGYERDINFRGTLFSNFSIHPKTLLTNKIEINSTFLDVDSTVGFPNAGKLEIYIFNEFNNTFETIRVSYTSKNLTQFIGCTGITSKLFPGQEIYTDAYAYSYISNDSDEKIKVRLSGVLSELNISEDTILYQKDNQIRVTTLGRDSQESKFNNWFYNVSTTYEIKTASIDNEVNSEYKISFYDDHNFVIGDYVYISDDDDISGYVYSISGKNTVLIRFSSDSNSPINVTTFLNRRLTKKISKVNLKNYQNLSIYNSNIQNTYIDSEKSLYVASPSLPSYLNTPLDIRDGSITGVFKFDGEYITFYSSDSTTYQDNERIQHGFYTGDAIVYRSLETDKNLILNGIYFVKDLRSENDAFRIKLSKSRPNIYNNNFVGVSTVSAEGRFIGFSTCFSSIQFFDFSYATSADNENYLQPQLVESQKLIRKISEPENTSFQTKTNPGFTGMFINGVEILNYKSKDSIFYGGIENITVSAPGFGYDIINPPNMVINDQQGSGAKIYPSVIGGLERIDIIDPGFNYTDNPKITIFGGNGFGASAEPKLISFDHEVEFNPSRRSLRLDLVTNTIGFSTYHKFADYEKVIYKSGNQTSLPGLKEDAYYYVSIIDNFKVKLHNSFSDAISGIGTVDILGYGSGRHILKSAIKKQRIGSISIINSGANYQTKKVSTPSSGINTANNSIYIKNHGFNNKELIVYDYSQAPISGLSSQKSYYVTKIDDDQFKLSELGIINVGLSTEEKDFYYNTQQYVNLVSTGIGTHYFNYEPIQVKIEGKIGVSTSNDQNFNAVIQPVFRGGFDSVFVEKSGVGYGSSDIFNYNRNPNIEIIKGINAQAIPIISSDGKIIEILVTNQGRFYNCVPDIIINGSGTGCVATPILKDGYIDEIKVIYSGINYSPKDTIIQIISRGEGSNFETKITEWNVNLRQRYFETNRDSQDQGYVANGLNQNYGLQYSHLFLPENLRKSVYSYDSFSDKIFIDSDNDDPTKPTKHSPIVGWAYDGNPIYGPYGYANSIGGAVKVLESGYVKKESRPNGPLVSKYPIGFFISDYEYIGGKDLDENNGRFCSTPEFPNGVYAYFCTIDAVTFLPVFPYVIGDAFKSQPIEFNFLPNSNQDKININETKWLRNTHPYNIVSKNSEYKYILNPNSIKPQISKIKYASEGEIQSANIVNGGDNYKVNDKITFTNSNESGRDSSGKVISILGKQVTNISVATSSFTDIEFEKKDNSPILVGFATIPHYLSNNDNVTIVTPIERRTYSKINVSKNILTLVNDVLPIAPGNVGLITYFDVTGNINYPSIRENDVYSINGEDLLVVEIDDSNSRIKVIRNRNGLVGIQTHKSGSLLIENPRKFEVNLGINTYYNLKSNYEYYFNPTESVGLGVSQGSKANHLINFANPGVGQTQITIPTKSLYLPNHGFETGMELIYYSFGGNSIKVSLDGVNSFNIGDKSSVYCTKISNDLIGISTVSVGVGSTGSTESLLFFTNVGTQDLHSFRTNYKNVLRSELSKNTVTVSTSSPHNLAVGDEVDITVKPKNTKIVKILYNDYNSRMVIDPVIFSNLDVDTDKNTIKIINHGYRTGEKIIYTSTSPMIGLKNNGIYFIVVFDSNKIALCKTYYDSIQLFPNIINFSNSTEGTISKINPEIKIIKNQKLIFDLSDSSLSYRRGSAARYAAFDFDLYADSEFKHKYYTSGIGVTFEVVKSGEIGVNSTSNLTLSLNDNTLNNLYYRLSPLNSQGVPPEKKNILVDNDQLNYNKVTINNSVYNGNYEIISSNSNSFKYVLPYIPERSSYNRVQAETKYITNSSSASGTINSIEISNRGKYFKSLPESSIIKTSTGDGATVFGNTNNIGKIKKIQIEDIGFDYPCDFSIRPTAKLPTIFKLNPLYSFDNIKITFIGKNYLNAPNLIVVDSFTNQVIDNVALQYKLGDEFVSILQNTKDLFNRKPRIIPVNNTNGVLITNITYNENTYDVTVTLGTEYSEEEDFPFEIGDEIFIENVFTPNNGRGFNSKNYGYSYFRVKSKDPNIGGALASVVFSLSDFITGEETEEDFIFDEEFSSSARIIPIKFFPTFDIKLRKNNFIFGETVLTSNEKSVGIVEEWDSNNDYLKVAIQKEFYNNDLLIGQTSKTKAYLSKIIEFDCDYKIDSFSIINEGWGKETGFLNKDTQRIHDNDYYQYFSYALKSKIPFDKWDDPVSSLNHAAGFKKFSDLIIESKDDDNPGITTSQNLGITFGISDIISEVNVNCVYDFDLVRETAFNIDNELKSDEIIFSSRILEDYIQSISNRVVGVDDISKNFNDIPRDTAYTIINRTDSTKIRSKKYFVYIQDRKEKDEKEMLQVVAIQDGNTVYLNQYARVETDYDMGYFEGLIIGSQWNILYYPTKSEVNNFTVDFVSFDMSDDLATLSSIPLGDSVLVENQSVLIPSGTSAPVTISGISSSFRASKLLIQISRDDLNYFEYNEMLLIHDDNNNVTSVEYGELTTGILSANHTSGIGTYYAYMSADGSSMNVDLIPNQPLTNQYNVKIIATSIANSQSSTVDFLGFDTGEIKSVTTTASASPTPTPVVVTGYDTQYKCLYGVVTVEDPINKNYQVCELAVINTDTNSFITEYAIIETNLDASPLGEFSTTIVAGNTRVLFTPNPNTEVIIKMFQISIGRF